MRIPRAGRALALALVLGAPAPRAEPLEAPPRIGLLGERTSPYYLGLRLPPMLEILGYRIGDTLNLEIRYPQIEGRSARALADELVALDVALIIAEGDVAIDAAREATASVPIVALSEGGPGVAGESPSPAAGRVNVTGVVIERRRLGGRRVELIREALPGLDRACVLRSPGRPAAAREWAAAAAAAVAADIELEAFVSPGGDDLEPALARIEASGCEALVVFGDSEFRGTRLGRLARRHRLPVLYPHGYYLVQRRGGLMSFGPSLFEITRHLAVQVYRILQGVPVDTLAVERPPPGLVLNRAAARDIGFAFPPALVRRAERVLDESR